MKRSERKWIFLSFTFSPLLFTSVNMEFTKTQVTIIVLEIIFIFSGIVAIFRAIKPKAAANFSSSALVSTTTAVQNAIYLPPTDEIFKKMDSKSMPEKSVTIEFGETKKKSGSTVNLDDEKPAGGKKKKTKKESEVITIDLGEEEKK